MAPRIALFLPSLEGGGAERAFVDLANDLAARGVGVDFVLASCSGPYVAELSPDVRIRDLGSTRWVSIIAKLAQYLRRERPDALLAGLDAANMAAVAASAIAGSLSTCVLSQRAVLVSVWQMDFPRTWRLWLSLMRQTYSRACLVICNSHAAANEVVHDLGVDAERCVVLYNHVDVDGILEKARAPLEDDWLASSSPPLVLTVGSLTARKDVETLLRAVAIVRRSHDCNVLILGEGGERERLERLVRELGLANSVRMPGFAQNPFAWMSRARVLVSASLAEGCPNVIQQALACGTPVVATDCPGGTAEVLENGRWGRLVPMCDPVAMAEAIIAALEDGNPPDGRIRARDFERAGTLDAYLRLLLPGHAPAHGQIRTNVSRESASR